MNETKRVLRIGWMAAFCLAATGWTSVAVAQDAAPLHVKAYVFVLAQEDLQTFLQDGLTRVELDHLQGELFAQGALLPGKEPVELKEGENSIDVTPEAVALLQNASDGQRVIFFFEITAAPGTVLQRRSWAVLAEGKEFMPKEGKWVMPATGSQYRFLDYRFASNFRSSQFVYRLTAEVGGQSVTVQMNLNLPK